MKILVLCIMVGLILFTALGIITSKPPVRWGVADPPPPSQIYYYLQLIVAVILLVLIFTAIKLDIQ